MKRALLVTAAVLMAGGIPPAWATPSMPCHDATEIAERLSNKYNEAPVAVGVQSNGNLLQVWASEDKGTWTLITTTPNGISCVVAAGKNWERIPFAKEDPTAALSPPLIYAHEVTTADDVVVDYRGWTQPNSSASCCGSGECRPTLWRFNPETRQEEILVGETWRPIDESKVIGVQPADEGAHVCTAGGSKAPDATIRCIVRPGFGA